MTDDFESNRRNPEEGSDEYWHLLTQPLLIQRVGAPTCPQIEAHKYEPHWEHDNVRRVSPETQQAAIRQLSAALVADPELRDILARQHNGIDLGTLVDDIRSNAETRYDLALHFRGKLQDRLDRMPRRVQQNGYKELNHGIYPPYDVLPSQDYVVMLALSLIDGTFDEATSHLDEINVEIGKGTHRASAQLILA